MIKTKPVQTLKLTLKRDGTFNIMGEAPEGFAKKYNRTYAIGDSAVYATNNLGLGDCFGKIVGFNRKAIAIHNGVKMYALTPRQFADLNWGVSR